MAGARRDLTPWEGQAGAQGPWESAEPQKESGQARPGVLVSPGLRDTGFSGAAQPIPVGALARSLQGPSQEYVHTLVGADCFY